MSKPSVGDRVRIPCGYNFYTGTVVADYGESLEGCAMVHVELDANYGRRRVQSYRASDLEVTAASGAGVTISSVTPWVAQ